MRDPDSKGYMLHDLIYMIFRRRQYCRDTNQMSCQSLGWEEKLTTKRHGENFGGDGTVLYLY